MSQKVFSKMRKRLWGKVKASVNPIANNSCPNTSSNSTHFEPVAPVHIRPRRLIDTHCLAVVEFTDSDCIPPYAILSHTWLHGEEVTFREFLDPQSKTRLRLGYQKILNACRLARDDSLAYIWIDTCCIDQNDQRDVMWNIQFMLAFYQNAEICYAYLVDISRHHEFQWSRWFKRGWTLQELLAPTNVVFFDGEWRHIGSKCELQGEISFVTSIPSDVLSGRVSFRDIPVAERLSWAVGRKTTKPQDQAYCLLGILGVSINLHHNEATEKFLERLQMAFLDTHAEDEEFPNQALSTLWAVCSHHHAGSSMSFLHPMAPSHLRPQRLIDTRHMKLVNFNEGDTIPPYAILSHRWIRGQEITFHAFSSLQHSTSNVTTSKSGYRKIQAACRHALEIHGLYYIWIDTCCIEQGDHDDVSRNIRSMYAYYQNAEVCFAYLADVTVYLRRGSESGLDDGQLSQEWRRQFRRSEWLRRGWTLQELLAPREVIFFDKDWRQIGSKNELWDEIAYETTIPRDVLSGQQSIRDVDPLERMSWAMGRKTTRPQDLAYCLQGLLGVSMDPDYDESVKKSFERLRKVFLDTYPEHREAFGSVDDFYSYLDGKYEHARWEAIAI